MIGGDSARIGGRAAAHLEGMLDEPPDEISVLIPHEQTATEPSAMDLHAGERRLPGLQPG